MESEHLAGEIAELQRRLTEQVREVTGKDALVFDLMMVGPDDVILIRDPEHQLAESDFRGFADLLRERFPRNFVVFLAGRVTVETRPLAELEAILKELVGHKEAAGEQG